MVMTDVGYPALPHDAQKSIFHTVWSVIVQYVVPTTVYRRSSSPVC